LMFDKYNRSTNDLKSHIGRYEILKEKLENFR
jgi:hypothetical protein